MSSRPDDFKVPFHVNIQPQPLMEQHFTLRPAAFTPRVPVSPYRRYGWQSAPAYLWYPALYGPACYTGNNFLSAPSDQLPADVTLGSLVDGKSNLLSPQSYNNAGYAAGNGPGATSPSPFAFQVGFYPMGCGTPGFTNL